MDYRKINKKELMLVANFIQSLKEENVEMFWNCISSANKKRCEEQIENFSNHDKTILLNNIKENFGEDLEDFGMANIIRFTNEDKTKGYVALQNNVKTEIHYLHQTDVIGHQLPLELDEGEFKINIFID